MLASMVSVNSYELLVVIVVFFGSCLCYVVCWFLSNKLTCACYSVHCRFSEKNLSSMGMTTMTKLVSATDYVHYVNLVFK